MSNINQNGNFHTPLSPMRFQSSMGKEVRRRYKDGKNVVRLSLARVVKVNYKYNTVDVVTIQHKNSTVKNPNDNGRYSARLPIQFGGQTPDNKIFGTNTLATVGSLVLVGFLEGNKDTPIVLNIYGDVDNQSMLTRTTYTGADESDESLQRELWQLFTLYPSMTYKNVDGHGNQEVTFPGKTFFYTSADDQKVNDAYFDYDHLPSAYYANGDLIEPKVEDAPNMLYVHQSVFGDHRVTFFVKSDGTVRVGSRHTDGKGITFWQLNTDGSFKIQQSNDTVDPEEESSNFSSFSINENGDIVLQAGSNILSIGKNGLLLNGGSVNGGSLDLSGNQIIKDLQGDIYTLQQATTATGIVTVVTESTPWQNLNDKLNTQLNGTVQTFISQPIPPYNIGDIWKSGNSIYICTAPEPIGATFNLADWSLSADVTSQGTSKDTQSVGGTPASDINSGISTAQSTAQSKTEMFLSQPTPPYNKGDIWNNNGVMYTANISRPAGATFLMADWNKAADITANNTSADTANVNGTPASDITSGITNAQNTADSKSRTFTSTPTVPYSIGDMWNQNSKVYTCTTAKSSSQSFNALDWVLVADVTSLNTSADTAKVNGVDASQVSAGATGFNNYTPGGRNYLLNTGSMNNLTNWSLNLGSNITATLNVVNDSVYGGVIDCNVTVNSATGNNWIVIQNTGLTLPNGKFTVGNTYTVSFLLWTALNVYVNFKDADGTHLVAADSTTIPANTGWQRMVYSFTATSTGNVPEFYLRASDTVHTGHIYVTQLQLEDGPKASGYNPAPEDVQNQITTQSQSIYDIEQGNFPTAMGTAIVNQVTSSTTYTSALSGKANSSDLSKLATNDSVAAAQASAQDYADKKIAGIDFSPFVKNDRLTQTTSDITAQFSQSGGVNMLMNSVGYNGTQFWTSTLDSGGRVGTTVDPAFAQYGTPNAFSLTGGMIQQVVTVTPGVAYTLSAYVNKGTAGTGYMKLDDNNGSTNTLSFASGTQYSYIKESITVTPTTSSLTVTLYGDSASIGLEFGCVMLNVGSNPFTWQQHMGEVYNANIIMDLNGIQVQQTDSNNKILSETIMSPTKFAGYSDLNNDGVIDTSTGSVDEIFRMDKDTFRMNSATIGPVKIVQLTSGGYNGIAFIASS